MSGPGPSPLGGEAEAGRVRLLGGFGVSVGSGTIEKGAPLSGLTAREQGVAVLVDGGFTNRQISTELSISGRTTASHVARILRKLGFRSWAQIAGWVAERRSIASDQE